MAGKLGINGADIAPAKVVKKQEKQEFKEFKVENVEAELQEQIMKIRAGRNNYLTLSKLAAGYKLTARKFREMCYDHDGLGNLLEIYNGIFVEHIMTQAISSGKINSQTEDFLKNELQAYTGSGFEQNITWIQDLGSLVDNDGVEFELEVDIDRIEAEEDNLMPWDNAEDKK